MKNQILLLIILLVTKSTFTQTIDATSPQLSIQIQDKNIPCDFSWEEVNIGTAISNFVTPAISQPYQGPCLAYAFISAIESKFAIENNINNSNMRLATHYFDYKMHGYYPDKYKPIFE